MALTDWYELKHFQLLTGGVEPLNVYHFMKLNPAQTAEDCVNTFQQTVLADIRGIQDDNVTHQRLEARNLGDATDFATLDLAGITGLVSGDAEPSFVAFKAQFYRERTDMKHGWKRIPGVPELAKNGNAITSGYQIALQGIVDTLLTGLAFAATPATILFRLGILKRVCAEFAVGGACISYRLPENDLELDFYIPETGSGHSVVSSQVSRKQ